VNDFYRGVIEANRKSRTADFTLRTIQGEQLKPALFSARFHTQPFPGEIKRYYGEFIHSFDDQFAARYYMFEDLAGVQNPFEFHCFNGLEWFVGVQQLGSGLNHELNGQSYACVEDLLGISGSTHSVFFGTPSSKFSDQRRALILSETAKSIENRVYDTALILASDGHLLGPEVTRYQLNNELTLLTASGRELPRELLERFSEMCQRKTI
jgi:hypothetical protein